MEETLEHIDKMRIPGIVDETTADLWIPGIAEKGRASGIEMGWASALYGQMAAR